MFLLGLAAHRAHPSFPTRRSSDLKIACPLHVLWGERGSVARGYDALAIWGERAAREQRCRARDRKSTRLNSSHVKISYAVFCLKKNKILHKFDVETARRVTGRTHG